ncbi:hypothetical protein [Saccharopolyspora pogona]|uniref:hypothetical protein n=1 Tax=Saccharopolyspora pogona TaxID=333966 RepID=UPI001CC25BF3|nr:hypothetical protein [Saccharopolyspora pogona]
MSDYTVVPEALRKNVKFLYDAADAWGKALQALTGKDLNEDDLGLLGGPSGATRNHNLALDDALERLKKGQKSSKRQATA